MPCLTTRELARMIRMRGLNLADMPSDTADTPFGERTTAGKLFGASGGVMEAAIRTAHYLVTGHELGNLEVQAVRGLDGVKEARVHIDGIELGVAVVSGLGNACRLLDQIRAGRNDLHFIEVMTCSRRLHRRRRAAHRRQRGGRADADAVPLRHRLAGTGARFAPQRGGATAVRRVSGRTAGRKEPPPAAHALCSAGRVELEYYIVRYCGAAVSAAQCRLHRAGETPTPQYPRVASYGGHFDQKVSA